MGAVAAGAASHGAAAAHADSEHIRQSRSDIRQPIPKSGSQSQKIRHSIPKYKTVNPKTRGAVAAGAAADGAAAAGNESYYTIGSY